MPATFGSATLDADIANRPAPVLDTPSSFNQGLRQGALDAGSKLESFAGGTARAMGYNDFAAARDAQARSLADEAATAGPRVQQWGDVHNMRDFWDYGTGMAGQMTPGVGTALGAGALTALTGGGALAGIAAGTAAMAPQEIGDVLQRQQAEGGQQDYGRAVGTGVLSSAAMNALPAVVGGAFLGQGVKAAEKGIAGQAERGALRTAATPGVVAAPGENAANAAIAQNLEARAAAQRALAERGQPLVGDVGQSAEAQAAGQRALDELRGLREPVPPTTAGEPAVPAGAEPPPPGGTPPGPMQFPDTFDPSTLPNLGGDVAAPHSPMPGVSPEGAPIPAGPAAQAAQPGAAVAAQAAQPAQAAAAARAAQPGFMRQLAVGGLKDAGIQAAGMGGSEAAKQYGADPNAPTNWGAIGDAAAGGAAMGLPLGMAHTAMGSLHQNKANLIQGAKDLAGTVSDATKSGYQKAKEGLAGAAAGAYSGAGEAAGNKDLSGLAANASQLAKEGYRAAVQKATEMVDRFKKAGTPVDDSMEKAVAEGSPLAGLTPEEVATVANTSADEETKRALVDKSIAKVKEWAQKAATGFADTAGLSQETRQRAAAIAKTGGDTADRIWLATQKAASAAKDATVEKINDITGRTKNIDASSRAEAAQWKAHDDVLARGGTQDEANQAGVEAFTREFDAEPAAQEQPKKGRKTLSLKKKSEDTDEGTSAVDHVPMVANAIKEHLFPLLPEHLMDNSPGSLTARSKFTVAVRDFLNTASKPGHNFLELEHKAQGIRDILGGDPDEVDHALMKVYAQAMFEDPKTMQRLTSTLQGTRQAGVDDRTLLSAVTAALPEHLKGNARKYTDAVQAYARGDSDVGQEASKAGANAMQNSIARKLLERDLGDKTDSILAMAEDNMTKARLRAEMERKSGLESDEAGVKEPRNPQETPADEHEQWIDNKKGPMARPKWQGDPKKVADEEGANELFTNSTGHLIDQMKAKHPNAEVDWVSEAERTGDKNAPKDLGRIRIRSQAQEGELDYKDLRSMKLDTGKLSRAQKAGVGSPRIEVDVSHLMEKPPKGGELTPEQITKNEGTRKQLGLDTKQMGEGKLILDAVQMARQGRDTARGATKGTAGTTDAVQLARGFYNAIAQLTEKLGVVPKFKEDEYDEHGNVTKLGTLIGKVNGEPFTASMAAKLDLSGPDDVAQARARDQETANRKVFTDARNHFERRVNELREQWHAATTDQQRDAIREKGIAEKQKLDEAEAKLGEFNKAADDVNSERVGEEHARQSGESIDTDRRDMVEELLGGKGRYEISKDANIHELTAVEGDRAPMFARGNPPKPVMEMKNGKETGNFLRDEKGNVVMEPRELRKKTAAEIRDTDTGGAGTTSFQQDSNRTGQQGRPQNVHPWALAAMQLADTGGIGAGLAEKISALALKRNANALSKTQRDAITEALGGNRDRDGTKLKNRVEAPKGAEQIAQYAENGWLGTTEVKYSPSGKTATVETQHYGNFKVKGAEGKAIEEGYNNYDPRTAPDVPRSVARVAEVVNPIFEEAKSRLKEPGAPAPEPLTARRGRRLDKNPQPLDEEGYASKSTGRSELADKDIQESSRGVPPKTPTENAIVRDPNYKGPGTYGPSLKELIAEHKASGVSEDFKPNESQFGKVETKTGPAAAPLEAAATGFEKAVAEGKANRGQFLKNYATRLEFLKGAGDSDGIAALERLRQAVEEPPGPKARAAKEAALEKAASSYDPELIDEVKTTDNASGLQASVNHLTTEQRIANVSVSRMAADAARHGDIGRLWEESLAMHDEINSIVDSAHPDDKLRAQGWAERTRARLDSVVKHRTTAIGLERANKLVNELVAKPGAKTADVLAAIEPHLPSEMRAVSRAVRSVIGDVPVGHMAPGEARSYSHMGTYSDARGVRVNPEGEHFSATVLLHEAVHAATIEGMNANEDLHTGVTTLMHSLLEHDPSLADEYGFKNAHEFVAEAMSNAALQERLKALPASDVAGMITGGTSIWDKFVNYVKKALGLKGTDNSALSQAIEMTSSAMAETKAAATRNTERTIETMNKRLDTLMQDHDNAYNSLKYSHDDADSLAADQGNAQGPRDIKGVLAELHRVLGNSIGVDVNALLGKGVAGTWDPIKNLIQISAHQFNVKSVAYHESLHAFFTQLYRAGSGKVADVLLKAGQSTHVQEQLRAYFKDQPAVLRSMTRDPEEAAAYMYQLWRQGDLKMNPQATTIFGKIAEFVRSTLGVWSNSDRALHIMDHFSKGEYAKDIGKPNMVALMKPGTNPALEMTKALFSPAMNMGEKVFAAGSSRLRDMGFPAMNQIADLVKTRLIDRKSDPGFLAAARQEHAVRMNKLANDLGNISAATQKDALGELQGGVTAKTPEGRAAVDTIRGYMQDMLKYVDPDGKWMGGRGPKYFPRVWDADTIMRNPTGFLNMIEYYKHTGEFKGDPRELMRTLTTNDGNDFNVDTRMPGFQSGKERGLAFISDEHAAPFLNKDLYKTINDYTSQATRRTEFANRFGENGEHLDELLAQARREGATDDHIRQAETYLKGVTGTLGDGINPNARRMMGNMTVYQNIRLLPLSVFSSAVDPLGIALRGGSISDAWGAYKRIARDIPKVFRDSGLKDWQTHLAETLGVVDNSTLMHAVGSLYTQGMAGNLGRKINDTFFKYNLMETVNRSTRISATEGALKFMQRHAEQPNEHSTRYLDELGLKKDDIQINQATGRVKTTVDEGLSQEHADRMRAAVHQWVDGAVLRPDNADRPIWFNDPHFMLLSHLKSFTYSFHHTIIDRIVHEAKHGNYQPMAVMASYIPVMLAADYLKGMIQGGGQQPAWKQDWGPSDYLWAESQRAGIYGVGQFGIDAYENLKRGGSGIGGLAGPTFDQLGEGIDVAGGRQRFGKFALDSMPANALYAGFIKGHAVSRDPTFAE